MSDLGELTSGHLNGLGLTSTARSDADYYVYTENPKPVTLPSTTQIAHSQISQRDTIHNMRRDDLVSSLRSHVAVENSRAARHLNVHQRLGKTQAKATNFTRSRYVGSAELTRRNSAAISRITTRFKMKP